MLEIVEGPAAVLYGAGYPGGVINFITKQPQFGRLPSTVDFEFGQNNLRKVIIDENQAWGDKAAVRIVGGWENANFQRYYTFDKNFDITPALKVSPFKSGNLTVEVEDSYNTQSSMYNCNSWLYPGGWFNAYQNPSLQLEAAAGITTTNASGYTPAQQYQQRIFTNGGSATYEGDNLNTIPGVTGCQNNTAGLPSITTAMMSPNGYYNNLGGVRVSDPKWNVHNRGALLNVDNNIFSLIVAASPTSWLDLHYTYSKSAELVQ